jgi:hypothetical protein
MKLLKYWMLLESGLSTKAALAMILFLVVTMFALIGILGCMQIVNNINNGYQWWYGD